MALVSDSAWKPSLR